MPGSRLLVLQELDAQIDSLRDEMRLAQTLADETNAHLDVQRAAARRDVEAIATLLVLRERERAETAGALPHRLRAEYEGLRARLALRPWVVAVDGAACPACSVGLPSETVAALRAGATPSSCPGCQRLLVGGRR